MTESGRISPMKYFEAKEFIAVAVLALVCSFIMLLAPESIKLLRYEIIAVEQGEWWRIFSANLTHSNWNHWLLNLTGLILIDYLYQPLVSQKQRISLLLFCMLLNVLFMHYTIQLKWYVGLSGALHGFLVGGALLSMKKAKYFSLLVLTVVAAKLLVELNFEVNQFTAQFIDANVVEEAHLSGAIAGIFYYLIITIYQLFKGKQDAL